MFGKMIAARLYGMGHEVTVGTRGPEETKSRAEPDAYGNPPFSAWQEEHSEVKLAAFSEAAAHGEMFQRHVWCRLVGGARALSVQVVRTCHPGRHIEPTGLFPGYASRTLGVEY